MTKTKTESAYQKMLLVTPLVYQKLLNCINEKDKVSTEELNITQQDEVKSPSERIIGQISDQDIGIQPEVTPIITENKPQNVTFSDTENIPTQNMPFQEIIPEEAYSNPLKNACPQDDDQGSIIPNLFYRPSFKTKRTRKPINLKQIQNKRGEPLALEYNPNDFSDTRTLGEQDIRSTQNLSTSFQPKTLRQEQKEFNIKPSSFPCTICGHDFTRKHDLKRHMESRTVHRNLKSINKSLVQPIPIQPVVKPIPLPPAEQFPSDNLGSDSYEFWGDQPSNKPRAIMPSILKPPKLIYKPKIIVPSITVTKPTAKLHVSTPSDVPQIMDTSLPKVLGKRTHGKAKLGNLRYPQKLSRGMEDIPEETDEFNTWKV